MAIEPGDEVSIEYVGRFEDGSVFDTSRLDVAQAEGLLDAQDADPRDYAPLAFTVGAGDIIEGLDEALVGMEEGEEATITVPTEKAYGEADDAKVREYDPETFEAMVGKAPEVGLHVEAENGLHGDVTAVRDDAVAVDFNHELAGRTLVFDVEVVDVR
ncbi:MULTISPECIES: FKBP-type peptidyl-prolyl cis-trans isomerase [Haloarcula]|uniref:Peptidyl-prolyl cis-trans isomerase n=1 Tax=Haloarcula pellucida TaxID=1427151 RepID=A0A830GG17_9EURY|nr:MULTISPECIES: peptidylprolyl isomerase [Halomicroarcula]MBX0346894.1 peptidylprolyl isomerase [Halomicroarcula pellucida]MDS0277232.1 peptidylprolyl isomerase [Halomicroarcula sp. S1AR25-4]QIO22356.1 peptidylprolyl isomerase [Haloarcula sp. JP-L23]GGN85977.1 peptidyl-prolyl cis-trans isomerase [Halomicroarcula pellucida]